MPRTSDSAPWIGKLRGRASDTYASPGSAPIAARSESAAASALWPMSANECVASWKWTPSAAVSIEVTANGRACTTAASSPVHRTTRSPGGVSAAWMASMSSRSRTATVLLRDGPAGIWRGAEPGRGALAFAPRACRDCRRRYLVVLRSESAPKGARAVRPRGPHLRLAHLLRRAAVEPAPGLRLALLTRLARRLGGLRVAVLHAPGRAVARRDQFSRRAHRSGARPSGVGQVAARPVRAYERVDGGRQGRDGRTLRRSQASHACEHRVRAGARGRHGRDGGRLLRHPVT